MFELLHTPSALPQDRSAAFRRDHEKLFQAESLYLYCQWLESRGYSGTTIKTYRSWVKRFISNCCGLENLPAGLPRELQMHELVVRFLEQLRDGAQYSPQSTNNFISAIESYCCCFELELPPVKRETVKREIRLVSSYQLLTRKEVADVMVVLNSAPTLSRDRAILLVFLHLGLSLRHCRELNVGDLSSGLVPGQLVLEYGRAGQRRMANINKQSMLALALLQWCSDRSQSVPEQALFISSAEQRLSVSSIDVIMRKIGWKAGVPLSIKLLRDTSSYFRSQALEA